MEENNNQITTDTIQTEPKTKNPNEFNYLAAYASNLNPADVNKIAEDNNYTVVLNTFEKDLPKLKELYPGKDSDFYKSFYEGAKSQYKLYKDKEFNALQTSRHLYPNTSYNINKYGKENVYPAKTVVTPYDKTTVLPNQIGGKDVKIRTEDQYNTSLGWFINDDGVITPMKYADHVDGYLTREYSMPDSGMPESYWKEKKSTEWIDPNLMRSYFGDRTLESSFIGTPSRAILSGIMMMESGVGNLMSSLVEISKDLGIVEAFFSTENKKNIEEAHNYIIGLGERMNNNASFLSKRNEDENDGFRGFAYDVFNGVGQMAPMIATGGFAGALGASARVATQISLLAGSLEGGAAWRNTMREMGIDAKTSAYWFFPFAAATYASENVLGANIAQQFFRPGGSKILKKSPQYCLKFIKSNFQDLLNTKYNGL
jgi:hypothetical protein